MTKAELYNEYNPRWNNYDKVNFFSDGGAAWGTKVKSKSRVHVIKSSSTPVEVHSKRTRIEKCVKKLFPPRFCSTIQCFRVLCRILKTGSSRPHPLGQKWGFANPQKNFTLRAREGVKKNRAARENERVKTLFPQKK